MIEILLLRQLFADIVPLHGRVPGGIAMGRAAWGGAKSVDAECRASEHHAKNVPVRETLNRFADFML